MEPPDGGGKRPRHGAAVRGGAVEMGGVDDLLREILVRLPDTASLGRAALACKRWRRVASDPSFLRRFHSLHAPPPLLGVIMTEPPPRVFSCQGANRLFVRVPRYRNPNPHLAATAAAADFSLKDFTAKNRRTGRFPAEWILRGCDSGRLLLTHGFVEHEEIAVYDPIARTAVLLRRPNDTQFHFELIGVHYALVAGDGAAFRVFAAMLSYDCVMGAVFDSRTGDWAALPTLEDVPYTWKLRGGGTRAGRFACWPNTRLKKSYEDGRTLVFDTIAMEWALIQVPFPAKESYCIADMPKHGGLCLVASKEQTVQLWVRDNDGWVIKKTVSLLKEFESLKRLRSIEWMKRVRILAARDDYIYMEFWCILKANSYLLVFNWETVELSVHANYSFEKYRGPAFPFFMTWAPPLLSPAEVQAPGFQGV